MSAKDFVINGFEIVRSVLSQDHRTRIANEVSVDHEVFHRTGIRNLEKKFSSIAEVAVDASVLEIVASRLAGTPRLVRALFFDKTAERNWSVSWHQDRTVTVNRRFARDGWGPWTFKDRVHHVFPPREVLDDMVTIRLHVDATDDRGGCLNVIPGSHRLGILTSEQISAVVANADHAVACAVSAGDAVVMRPLLVHASCRSQHPSHRRVVHLEFSGYDLPYGVSWA